MNEAVKRLLAGCRRIEAKRQREEAGDVRVFMRRLRGDMPGLLKRARLRERRTAPGFNVFRALGIERRESILHTPFLAHLLNPEGDHGQGFLFLSHFFNALRSDVGFVQPPSRIESCSWQVEAEVPAGQLSIIDLLVECPAHGYVLVLENKIDAPEGEDQIWKYADWIKRARPRHHRRQMVFLTPEGRAPVSNRDIPCVQLSFRDDIRRFLESALPLIKAATVAASVNQYLSTVKRISRDSP